MTKVTNGRKKCFEVALPPMAAARAAKIFFKLQKTNLSFMKFTWTPSVIWLLF